MTAFIRRQCSQNRLREKQKLEMRRIANRLSLSSPVNTVTRIARRDADFSGVTERQRLFHHRGVEAQGAANCQRRSPRKTLAVSLRSLRTLRLKRAVAVRRSFRRSSVQLKRLDSREAAKAAKMTATAWLTA